MISKQSSSHPVKRSRYSAQQAVDAIMVCLHFMSFDPHHATNFVVHECVTGPFCCLVMVLVMAVF